ncbi:hypothetical protein J437_LFUL008808 [Ladona fulva]|uniref:KASH domain-containing protein n=1 Tax=Ladona fulva TaxID=123851 RepID=A0A8K0P1J7_LADFU|nr:hypothetical protein J437_LFUL008808 [Ladona fulva]
MYQLKNELTDVNVVVNRFLTGSALPIQCPSVSTSAAKEDSEENPNRADYLFLKEEVAQLYREWDESLERLNAELSVLQRAARTWAELEEGLASLGLALDSDRNTLTTLSSAVAAARSPRKQCSMAQTPALLAASVRELARVLSEEKVPGKQMGPRGDKEDECDEWDSNLYVDGTDLNGVPHVNLEHSIDPLGSLSDSGISDSGSEGLGMCERGRRLAVLRKLARILAATLGPNSAAILALKERMDDAQKELRTLQKTCRDLVVCTAMLCTANQNRSPIIEESASEAAVSDNKSTGDGVLADDIVSVLKSSESNTFNRLRVSGEEDIVEGKRLKNHKNLGEKECGGKGKEHKRRKHWAWRALYLAMPFQFAIVLLLCAAYFLEPHCCSALNNLSFSLSPQLRYVRGPPPT